MQSVVLISFGSCFSSMFENSVVFPGVVGMGWLWAMLILNLFVSAILESKFHFFNAKHFISSYR